MDPKPGTSKEPDLPEDSDSPEDLELSDFLKDAPDLGSLLVSDPSKTQDSPSQNLDNDPQAANLDEDVSHHRPSSPIPFDMPVNVVSPRKRYLKRGLQPSTSGFSQVANVLKSQDLSEEYLDILEISDSSDLSTSLNMPLSQVSPTKRLKALVDLTSGSNSSPEESYNQPSCSYASKNQPSCSYPAENQPSCSYAAENQPSCSYASEDQPSCSYASEHQPSSSFQHTSTPGTLTYQEHPGEALVDLASDSDSSPEESYNQPSYSHASEDQPSRSFQHANRPGILTYQDHPGESEEADIFNALKWVPNLIITEENKFQWKLRVQSDSSPPERSMTRQEIRERNVMFPLIVDSQTFPSIQRRHRREQLRRQQVEQPTTSAAPSVNSEDFFLDEEDEGFLKDLAKIYSYSEDAYFKQCLSSLEEFLKSLDYSPDWNSLSEDEQDQVLYTLLDNLDSGGDNIRNTLNCFLYLVQGCWATIKEETQLQESIRKNVFYLLQHNMFKEFVKVMKTYTDRLTELKKLDDSEIPPLMTVLNILCTITETVLREKDVPNSEFNDVIEYFCLQLLAPNDDEGGNNEKLLIITLFDLLVRFSDCKSTITNFPVKKVLLLLWKLLILALGSLNDLEKKKKKKRKEFNLPVDHDTVIDHDEQDETGRNDNTETDVKKTDKGKRKKTKKKDDGNDNKQKRAPKKKRPKVYLRQLTFYCDNVVKEYVDSHTDRTTILTLPPTIEHSLNIIWKHVYMSHQETQIYRESLREYVSDHTPAEIVYTAMYPKFPVYIKSMLKIMTLIIFHNTREFPECQHTAITGIDSNLRENVNRVDSLRYAEIIMQSISTIILLLQKHLKLNHVYQFEQMCQLLHENNFIFLFTSYIHRNNPSIIVGNTNDIALLEYPTRVFQKTIVTRIPRDGTISGSLSQRNLYICINFFRILNKIAKNKKGRIKELFLLGTFSLARHAVTINHYEFKLYACKLLKMLVIYLTPRSKMINMDVVADIYRFVRFHLFEDYLIHDYRMTYGTTETPNTYVDEKELKKQVDKYIQEKYPKADVDVNALLQMLEECNCLAELNYVTTSSANNLPPCFATFLQQWSERRFLN